MTTPPRQLPLDLPHRPDMDHAAFMAGAANREALALVESWPAWTGQAALICGPTGSGKSHLAAIWRDRSGALSVAPAAIGEAVAALEEGVSVLVEDIDRPDLDESGLFHCLNLARERGFFVLMTSHAALAGLDLKLPDLLSRLRAAQSAALGAPDDELLRALLQKLFADRQVTIEPAVLDFILRRMERSFGTARDLVARLDAESLAVGKSVTRSLAGRVLGESGVSD